MIVAVGYVGYEMKITEKKTLVEYYITTDGDMDGAKLIDDETQKMLNAIHVARDDHGDVGAMIAELDLLDHLSGAGCPSPEAALVAALLWFPQAIPVAQSILHNAGAFEDKNLGALYVKILRTPYHGDPGAWWLALGIEDVLAVARYEFMSVLNVREYAEIVIGAAAQRRQMALSSELALGIANDSFPIGGIVGRKLIALEKHMMKALPPDNGEIEKIAASALAAARSTRKRQPKRPRNYAGFVLGMRALKKRWVATS